MCLLISTGWYISAAHGIVIGTKVTPGQNGPVQCCNASPCTADCSIGPGLASCLYFVHVSHTQRTVLFFFTHLGFVLTFPCQISSVEFNLEMPQGVIWLHQFDMMSSIQLGIRSSSNVVIITENLPWAWWKYFLNGCRYYYIFIRTSTWYYKRTVQ